ncbi:MAG TPA: type IV pili methyl-accepting chemotaxis transducer N-terminal domain-containing protein [Aromatoleum sp.]|uniref:type IV pili methyl-accepting chemotaxis transducer N-terminal domain-containing protein n=1 Tax=Aromatoleum sp. TaxID=2307007 RepID=UPI002B473B9C|nr:type IV pili methyl-accepting chemotaxis transducer N-terminal domain-containing protein [Aromatoleum sp.]HJV25472.1 type IV pili methyl-accepting chemotaxis transducer N-terminal domain-containing protein [Aromatoleum sp.]
MLRKLVVLFASLLVTVTTSAAEPISLAGAIGVAGEQRMLSQRLAKAYVQAGLDVVPDVAREQLRDSMNRLDANLVRLRAVSAEIPATEFPLQQLVLRAASLREAASVPVSKDAALQVSRRSLDVLDSAEELVGMLETAPGGQAGHRVNLAGRQRMLSQRLVKAYMLYSWGVDRSASLAELEDAAREFTAGLARLGALPDNSTAMRQELDEIALQWEWLQTALSAEGASSFRLVVAEAGDSILSATDRLTLLYEQVGSR